MAYKKINLIIRNLYEFITEKIEDEGYAIGNESGKMGIFTEFPVEEFKLPAVSMSVDTSRPLEVTSLGYFIKKSYTAIIDIFARTKVERDQLISILTEALEKNDIELKDYNEATPSKIASMQFEDIEGSTMRIVSVGAEQENRGKINFVVSIEKILNL